MSDGRKKAAERCRELSDAGEYVEAMALAELWLLSNPNDVAFLTILSYCTSKINQLGRAYTLSRRCTELAPTEYVSWLNFGMAADHLWRVSEARRAYEKALRYAKNARQKMMVYSNLAALEINLTNWEKGREYALKALEMKPGHIKARSNLGFCQLANGEWEEGWKNYRNTIGTTWRQRFTYGDEPDWDGSHVKTLVLHGEQGLGDQLCFASMLPDVAERVDRVILDTDHRLQGLLQRSFPEIKVYGTLGNKNLSWAAEDRQIDASLPMGQVGEYVRTSDEDFPKTTFLKPCPIRKAGWEKTFKAMKKPVIGIAWRGGIPQTGALHRQAPLDDWIPLFKAIDAHYVSLQYKPSQHEIDGIKEKLDVDLVEYPWATLSQDYDDTAAMVSAMDLVLTIPTTVMHLGGALGTPTIVCNAKYYCWKTASGLLFHPITAWIPWNGSWKQTITDSIPEVKQCLFSSGMTSDYRYLTKSSDTPLNDTHQSV